MHRSLISISLMAAILSACGGGSGSGGDNTPSSQASSFSSITQSVVSSSSVQSSVSSAVESSIIASSEQAESSAAEQSSSEEGAASSAEESSVSSVADSSSGGQEQSSTSSEDEHSSSSSEESASASSTSSDASESSSSAEESSAFSSEANSSVEGLVNINWLPSANAFKVGGSSTAISGSVTTNSADVTSFSITGGKFESSKEAFFYINQTVNGDFVFTANISSWGSGTRSGSDQGSVGILLCDNCENGSSSVPVSAKIGVRDTGIIHTERLSVGGTLVKTSMGNNVTPSNQLYLRITRTGNQVELAYSNDGGTSYDLVRTSSFSALSNNLRIGIYAAQGTDASNNFGVSNISLLANSQENSSSSVASSASSNQSSSQLSSTGSSNQGGQSSSTSSNQANSSSSAPYIPVDITLSQDCIDLTTNPTVNWRDTALQTDQEIVECLYQSLGRPVGYGENAMGGYDPNGNSKLTIITKNSSVTVEQQLLDALTDNVHNWIVFDKVEFANEHEIGMYRSYCNNSTVLGMLDASETECNDYWQWCTRKGFSGEANCRTEFFNKAMNNKNIPIRIPAVGSNKTLDGRMSKAYFMFSGFAIGKDSDGVPTQTSNSIIFTHLDFRGAGHVEDHYVDPDMIRSTGFSSDIWIHKNTFDTTGDSAFDVKIGAHNITISFNRLVNVKRAVLHGSSDSREINQFITTTMHHNAFVTTDDSYKLLGNTLRRVPLLRRGTTHMFNNVFVNYRKEVLSLRVGARAFLEGNVFIVNVSLKEKSSIAASLAEIQGNLFKDISGGFFRNDRNFLWFGSGTCILDDTTKTHLTATNGSVDDLSQDYNAASLSVIDGWRFEAGQDLIDYVILTAGKNGDVPFNTPLSPDRTYMEALAPTTCQ
ncbi:pectate lyase family protein [Cellvibrio japonicus]|uniref:Pectate lyase, putative, pel1C n=1 Tax=Cellvibrio japonicus (strain Ueda107) TaxID=498211 RepID=B3PFC8_CELJU|nr:pectate lyase [Cellvibrio japonicus]ACE82841.1 pectate lyase, putative, pel1C [Cellvibrio japonicus Ueda107]